MANVIKLKRGSGSDPGTSDLVVGEVAVRTDNGKLFTKKDNGSIAEISGSGGANEISINTLSSSSGSGGGSASFNGSATRFTLSNPPSVSAQQLLVSVNGVIQKPNSGTSPSEGFAIDGNDILFASAPATGSDFFILTYSSLSVGVPSDNSVTSAKITDLTIVNGDISNTAAIAVSKLANFVTSNADNRLITGSGTANTLNGESELTYSSPQLKLLSTSAAPQIRINSDASDGSSTRLTIGRATGSNNFVNGASAGDSAITFPSNLIFGVQTTEKMRIDSSGRLLLGTTTEGGVNADDLTIANTGHAGITIRSGTDSVGSLYFSDGTSGDDEFRGAVQYNHTANYLRFYSDASERMRIDSSGRLLIGLTSGTSALLQVDEGAQVFGAATNGNSSCLTMDYSSSTGRIMGHGSSGGTLAFFTNASGAGVSERVRINSSGNLTVGTTNDNNGGSAGTDDGVVLQKVGHVIARMDGATPVNSTGFTAKGLHTGGYTAFRTMSAQTQVGGITFNSGGTSFNTSSDYRRKENIIDLTGAITRIKTLIPKRFNFIDEPGVTRDGFLAHEVTTVPEAIWGEKDAVEPEDNEENDIKKGDPIYQQLDQSKLVPLLVAALQEAIVRIEALEAG